MTADAKQAASLTAEAETRRLQAQRREREIRRLETEQAHREGRIEPDEREGWERSREWLERHGSYRELRVLVAELPDELRRALLAVHGPDRELRTVGPGLALAVRVIVDGLAQRMPVPIRVPASLVRDEKLAKQATWRGRSPQAGRQRASRDERLVEAVRLRGMEVAAGEFGLSVRHVRRVVRGFEQRQDVRAV